jgi:hypothetical protein
MSDEEEFLPILISYDELIDMWSYHVGDHVGVADDKSELVSKVWELIRKWNDGEEDVEL